MSGSVLHINTADISGGAARSGYRIHQGLKKRSWTSRILVKRKYTADQDIDYVASSPLLSLADRISGKLWDWSGWQYYAYPSSSSLLSHPWVESADVIQLYNTHGNYFSVRTLPALSQKKPVVWRLSDMWPFTGHCAYSYDCDRWKTGCGSCPYLKEYPPLMWDRTASLWQMKKEMYDQSQLTIVAPSTWIGKLAKESPLLGQFPVHTIPNGIDLQQFSVKERREARRTLNIPDSNLTLIVQSSGPGGERKGLNVLRPILQAIGDQVDERISLLVFGEDASRWTSFKNVDVFPQGKIQSNEKLNVLFNAADLFIFPTLADNLPNVILESMACGTPVLSFDVGGVGDAITTGKTGWLVKDTSVDQLVRGFFTILKQVKVGSMREACRSRIETNFNQESEAARFDELYQTLIQEGSTKNG